MATLLFDLDGTIFKHSTQELITGAKETLDKLHGAGHRIVFITRRGNAEWGAEDPVYSRRPTLEAIERYQLPCDDILWDCHSPRVIVDDSPCHGHRHGQNQGWLPEEMAKLITLTA